MENYNLPDEEEETKQPQTDDDGHNCPDGQIWDDNLKRCVDDIG